MVDVAHASDIVENPSISTLAASTIRAPNLSTSQPMMGDVNVAARPPRLDAPAIIVRLQPSSSDSGYTKTAIVRLAAALRTNMEVPAEKRTAHP